MVLVYGDTNSEKRSQHSPMHTCSFTVFSDNKSSVFSPEAL